MRRRAVSRLSADRLARRTGAAIAAVMLFGIAGACSGGSSDRAVFDLFFEAKNDTGQPVPGVVISGNGKQLGMTGAEGVLHAFVRAKDGSSLRARAVCPEGYREPVQPAPMRLRRFRSIDRSDRGELRVTIECRATERLVALVVNTNKKADLPVLMDGREIARTNAEGVAHIALRVAPNSTFQVALDTSANEALRPKSPLGTFSVADSDSLVVFDQSFDEVVKRKKRHHRRKVKPPPEDPRPTKIVGPKNRKWHSVGR